MQSTDLKPASYSNTDTQIHPILISDHAPVSNTMEWFSCHYSNCNTRCFEGKTLKTLCAHNIIMHSKQKTPLETEKYLQTKQFSLKRNVLYMEQGTSLQMGYQSQPITDADMKVDVCDWLEEETISRVKIVWMHIFIMGNFLASIFEFQVHTSLSLRKYLTYLFKTSLLNDQYFINLFKT